jgi:hypothetical protein
MPKKLFKKNLMNSLSYMISQALKVNYKGISHSALVLHERQLRLGAQKEFPPALAGGKSS